MFSLGYRRVWAIAIFGFTLDIASAFVSTNFGMASFVQRGRTIINPPPPAAGPSPRSPSRLNSAMVPFDGAADSALSSIVSSASILLSTIDSDIANIPDNEFASVFAGGIVVMFGGLLSALVVGTILDFRNSYSSVLGEAPNMDSADVESFLESLPPEDREQAEKALQKFRESKKQEQEEKEAALEATKVIKKEEKVSLFSDYDD